MDFEWKNQRKANVKRQCMDVGSEHTGGCYVMIEWKERKFTYRIVDRNTIHCTLGNTVNRRLGYDSIYITKTTTT